MTQKSKNTISLAEVALELGISTPAAKRGRGRPRKHEPRLTRSVSPNISKPALRRTRLHFTEITPQARWKRNIELNKLLENEDSFDILFCARQRATNQQDHDMAWVITELLKSKTEATTIRQTIQHPKKTIPDKLHKEQCLAFKEQQRLSRTQYDVAYQWSKEHNLLYCCRSLAETRKLCFPKTGATIEADPAGATVPLEDLSQHSFDRTLEIPGVREDFMEAWNSVFFYKKAVAVFKGEFDGCGGKPVNRIKKVVNAEGDVVEEKIDWKNLHISSITILMIIVNDTVVWQNPVPNSGDACRPFEIKYEKESAEQAKRIYDDLKIINGNTLTVHDDYHGDIPVTLEFANPGGGGELGGGPPPPRK